MENKEILSNLLKPAYKKDNQKWKDYLETISNSILWYPSAGVDFMEIIHIDQDGLNSLFEKLPTIIHSDTEEYPCFFNDEPFSHRESNIRVNFRIPLLLNFNPPPPEAVVNEPLDIPPPETKAENPSGIKKLLKPKTKKEIREIEKKFNLTWDEVKNYLEKPRKIQLFNVDVATPQNEVNNQYVLYFFWPNITFFKLLVNDQNLPVDCILSNRDSMDIDTMYLQFWQLLSENQFVRHLICDNGLYGTLNRIGNDLVQLQFLLEYQWDDVDSVRFYEVVR
jgi:hypothetical protein